MTVPAQPRRYTLEEYFEVERNSPEKHEFRDGEIINLSQLIGMAGGAVPHALITTNISTALRNALRGGSCRVYSSDQRVRIPKKTLYTFPDATIVCRKLEVEQVRGIGDIVLNPQVIVEVLSPSTEAYDRGGKFNRYREIPSLREYVLVPQNEPRIEVFHHANDGGWSFLPVEGMTAHAILPSLGIQIPLAEVFDGVEFPPVREEGPI